MIPLTVAGKLNVTGLIIAVAGVLTLFAVGAAAPQALIGVVLLLAVAALVLFGPWRWTSIIGVLLPLLLCIAAVISPGFFFRVTHPEIVGMFTGSVLQVLGLLIAFLAGVIVIFDKYRVSGVVKESKG
jgi:hypothetical protein